MIQDESDLFGSCVGVDPDDHTACGKTALSAISQARLVRGKYATRSPLFNPRYECTPRFLGHVASMSSHDQGFQPLSVPV